jgi:hypothetical protein
LPDSLRKLVHRTLLIATLLVGADVYAWGKEANPGLVVADPHYGEVLFHFYQQDDFTALTHLLAARQSGQVPHHAVESELLLGGLYLSYGQHEQAGKIFSTLLSESSDPTIRDRVWFYIGKARYQRSQFPAADEAFAKVGADLPIGLASEHRMLSSQSLMAQGRFSEAAAKLDVWDGSENWLAYANFNLGVALVRTDRLAQGSIRLDSVGQTISADPDLVALRDKANLALGYAYLQAEQPGLAKQVLQRVRLQGPFSSKALLGVGWADAKVDNYRSALTPWLELQDGDLLDSAVQESLLAVPYALTRLGANGSAADYYVNAVADIDSEIIRLDAAIARGKSGELVRSLLAHDEREIGRWHWSLESLPASDDARYLYHLIAKHNFQDGLRNYRDLQSLRAHLAEWQQKMSAYEDMVMTRRLAYQQRVPVVAARLAKFSRPELSAKHRALASRLARIEAERDVVGLADAREVRLWQDITRLESNVALGHAGSAEARTKHRVLKGLLLWELDADFRYRLWHQKRELAELDSELQRSIAFESRVVDARNRIPVELDEYAHRTEALAIRLASMQSRITLALGDQDEILRDVVVAELAEQKVRLTSYRVQARFALATIYDQATVASQRTGGANE